MRESNDMNLFAWAHEQEKFAFDFLINIYKNFFSLL